MFCARIRPVWLYGGGERPEHSPEWAEVSGARTTLYGGGERPEHSPTRSLRSIWPALYGGGERPEHSPDAEC